VVDNGSRDGTVAMLHTEFPTVRIFTPDWNTGFAGGNNVALRALLAREESLFPEMVLLLNPDTEPIGDAIPRLVASMQQHPEVVVVGPRLRYADGSNQSSRRRFPRPWTFFWESTPLERWWPSNPWVGWYRCADMPDRSTQAVDWLVGAALLVRGTAIRQAGLLDERFFMYSEELEWQYRLAQTRPLHNTQPSSPIVYVPEAVIIHHEGKSSEQVQAARHIHFQGSKLRLAQLWYGQPFAKLLRGFLWLGYLWELWLESLKYLAGHRQDLRRTRMQVYALVLQRLTSYDTMLT
jgi:GT2 family glycosyltransferase